MKLCECNPFVRAAEIQPAVLEGTQPRMAYDHRLFYVLENGGQVIIDGASYNVSSDMMIFIPPETGYYFIGKIRVAVLNLDMTRGCAHRTKAICPPPIPHFKNELLFDRERADGFVSSFIISGDIVLRDAVLEIVQGFEEGATLSDALCSARLKLLLTEIIRRSNEEECKEQQLIREVKSYIRINAATVSGNTDIAQVFGYHPVYLAGLFKSVTGMTMHEAITDERIKLACRWLTQTEMGIDDIALSTGFCSRSHFCTVFKAKTGMTPSGYRKKA